MHVESEGSTLDQVRSGAAGSAAPLPRARVTIERPTQLIVIALLALGCWLVIEPFFTALMFSAVVGVSTWPAYQWLLHRLRGRVVLASAIAWASVLVLAVGPLSLLFISLVDGLRLATDLLQPWIASAPSPPPQWLGKIPIIGPELVDGWQDAIAGRSRMGELLGSVAEPARNLMLAAGRQLGNALMQVVLVVFLLYFVYRHGDVIGDHAGRVAERAGGDFARELLGTARRSIVSVMVGIVGAGLAQASVATIGFAVAGVPNPFLFGALTFVLSLVAFGPPILWGGATLWLAHGGETGWAIFMAAYGFLVISSVDNLLKPFIISRASHMAFAWTLIGVIGGLFAFGIMGVFLGPALLAVSASVARHWLDGGS